MPAAWYPDTVSVEKTFELLDGVPLEQRRRYGHLILLRPLNPWHDRITGVQDDDPNDRDD